MSQPKHDNPVSAERMRIRPDAAEAAKDEKTVERSRTLNAIARTVAAQYQDSSLSPAMLSGIIQIIEGLLIALVGALTYETMIGMSRVTALPYSLVIVGGPLVVIAVAALSGAYHPTLLRRPFAAIDKVVFAFAVSIAVFAIGAFVLKISAIYSRAWIGSFVVSAFLAVMVFRIILSRMIVRWSRNGRLERRALIVGGGPLAEKLIRRLESSRSNDLRICGIFDDREDSRSPPIVAGYPKLGTIDDLIDFARLARIDILIVTIPVTAERRVLAMLKKLWVLPVDIRLSAHTSDLQFRPRAYQFIGDVPTLPVFDRPITDWNWVAKRAFDITFSLLGILLFSPVMIAAAIAIKLDSKGPILFRQKRHGFNNESIDVYKFRSMHAHMSDPTGRLAVTRNDPRVTRVGRFIRKTSIDELPQFFNALLGSLSLVGPRPHAVNAQTRDLLFNEVVDGYFARHRVKPGVTGWAQINGWRGEIDSGEKIQRRTEFDLYYIENWSLWFDLKILLLTPIRLFSRNAY